MMTVAMLQLYSHVRMGIITIFDISNAVILASICTICVISAGLMVSYTMETDGVFRQLIET